MNKTITGVDYEDGRCVGVMVSGITGDQATVYFERVRHGRWLTWEEQFPGEKPRRSNNLGVFCDKCHNHADNRTDFCPNCGAKMDFGKLKK